MFCGWYVERDDHHLSCGWYFFRFTIPLDEFAVIFFNDFALSLKTYTEFFVSTLMYLEFLLTLLNDKKSSKFNANLRTLSTYPSLSI